MNIIDNLCIATVPSKWEPNKPYVLWIEGHGRVGEKLSQGAGHAGKKFPINAADRFETRAEAVAAYYDFLEYAKDMIRKKKAGSMNHTPSYYQWQ